VALYACHKDLLEGPEGVSGMNINPPDLVQQERPHFAYEPSWASSGGFVNDEHRAIYEATRDYPGWQDPADSEKLYEMGFHNGSVILEIGVFGGRSAVVELRGALAARAKNPGLPPPQFFGVDVDGGFVDRSFRTLTTAGLADQCLLFHGDFARFLREMPIVPTMVFVDGDHRYPGCWADLKLLAEHLASGTPVMCHDYGGIPAVRRAVDEWIASGLYDAMGQFAGSMLLRARGVQGRRPRGLSPGVFSAARAALLDRYFATTPPMLRLSAMHTPVRDLTAPVRRELGGENVLRVSSRRAAWPFAAPDAPPLPATMSGGYPWPRITVVTPSYNQGRYIEETILSVRNQGYPNLEHIVMDGGSTDQTREVVERYRDGIAHFVGEKDEGQSDAINKGFALATGDILMWLNSDDMLAPGALAAAALAIRQSGADMVAGECHIYRDGKLIQRHLTSCENGPLSLDDLLDIDNCWMAGQFFYQPEVMFTRELWEKAGSHVRQDLYHSMDYELWLRFAHAGAKLHVIGRPAALFRAHDEQKTAGDVGGGFRAELPKARDAFLERIGKARPAPHAAATRRSLRVVMFNDLGYAYGAGIAHRRLAEAFLAAGHQVFAVAATSNDHHASTPQATFTEIVARIASLEPDLVVVGNLHGAHIDPAVLGQIGAKFPTAFVMHDLWLLTGRCAYTGGCRTYISGCGEACTCAPGHPVLPPEEVGPAWKTKRRVLENTENFSIWGNSDWAVRCTDEALAASPSRPPAAAIKFGFDLEVLRPRDKATCRDALGLPRDAFIIMSSASSVADPRKGLAHLAEALQRLQLPDVLVTCVGWHNTGETPPIPGMRPLGYTTDPQRLAMIYAAADLFVGPSLEEAFGQVFIEAAACGTPSIGYPVDGKPEAILDGVSGVLTHSVSSGALAEAIEELYANPAYRQNLGKWGRLWVENEWSLSASYHRISCVMRRHGLADRLGLVRKIDLAIRPPDAPEPVLLRPTFPAWRPVSNFDYWEGPYPDRNLPRCRWTHGPVASFEIDSDRSTRQRLMISCRSFDAGQRVRLVHNGRIVDERPVPVCAEHDHVLWFDLTLEAGRNTFDMHFWRWNVSGRPLALLITGITCVGEGGRIPLMQADTGPVLSVAVESKQPLPAMAN
jgi:glycosyltransferase involved in cell wall biosynthesis